jgi:hypothetical protein
MTYDKVKQYCNELGLTLSIMFEENNPNTLSLTDGTIVKQFVCLADAMEAAEIWRVAN